MKRTYVRGHYRRSRKSKAAHPSLWGAILLLLLLVAIVYLLRFIPLWVYLVFFSVVIIGIAIFVSVIIMRFIGQKRLELEQQNQQPQMQIQRQPQRKRAVLSTDESFNTVLTRERIAHLKTRGDVLTLTPLEFEEMVGHLLSLSGYTEVIHVGGSGDLGADVTALTPQGKKVVVQCKRYGTGNAIGTPDLQKFIGMIFVHHKADEGIFVTASSFKPTAIALAQEHRDKIRLIDGDDLVKWIHNTSALY